MSYHEGFLRGIAENGVTPTEAEAYLEKRAGLFQIEPSLGSISNVLKGAFIDFPVGAGVVAGGVGGIGLGALAHMAKELMTQPTSAVEDNRQEMLADELRFQIEQLRRNQLNNR